MNLTTMWSLLKLSPSKLNIALLLLGITGMLWSYKQGQSKIDELQAEMRVMQREFKNERDSLYRSSQVAEALCNQRVLDGQTALINRLDALNDDLNEQLGRKTSADARRLEQANRNAKLAKNNTSKLTKLNESIEKN